MTLSSWLGRRRPVRRDTRRYTDLSKEAVIQGLSRSEISSPFHLKPRHDDEIERCTLRLPHPRTQSAMKLTSAFLTLALAAFAHAHPHEQAPLSATVAAADAQEAQTWLVKYGKQVDLGYTGPLSFSHLDYHRCLEDETKDFDIAVLGMPFDTAVSYRPGARFGPFGIRSGSRRQHGERAWTLSWGMDPYRLGTKVIDCGDVSGTIIV